MEFDWWSALTTLIDRSRNDPSGLRSEMVSVRLPSPVLEIVAGIVVGPAVLGIAHSDQTVAVMSTIGLAFLLFLAGIEIEFDKLRGNVLKLTAIGFAASFAIAVASGFILEGVRQIDNGASGALRNAPILARTSPIRRTRPWIGR